MARRDRPKYQAIADDLRTRIASGEVAPGERLPSQSALAAEYRVTVMTLRQAIAELERDGLVRASAGRGTFVADPTTVSFGVDRLSSFAQEMAQQGVRIETEVRSIDVPSTTADTALAAQAGVVSPSGLATVVRRRSIDGVPVVVQRSTMPTGAWRRLDDVDLSSTSLYEAMADLAGRRVERASETFRAVSLGADAAGELEVPERSAALESVRVSYDDDGAFLVDRALMVGSATEIRAERTADDLRLGYATPG